MRTLKESLLSDLDTTLSIGDDYDKMYKKAEKDYKKLLAKTKGKSTGQFYCISIKSLELAYILANEHPAYQHFSQPPYKYPVDTVTFIYNIDEAFDGNRRRYIQVNVDTKSVTGRNVMTVVASHVEYCKANENIDNGFDPFDPATADGLSIQQGVKIISKAFSNKYSNIEQLKEAFVNNVKYTAKY
jgi:hypothetical protein